MRALSHERSRRRFLGEAMGCAAWLAAGLPAVPGWARQARGRVVAEAPFARIEALSDGVWAVVSTPLRDGGRHFETTANGGIVAGRDAVAVIEGYYSDEGAAWVATQVRALAGRAPDRVLITHFHADHCRGLRALGDGVDAQATPTTARLMAGDPEQALPQPSLDEQGPGTIDLGGRRLMVTPRLGHTASDVTVRLEDPPVLWCGDLVWNHMFPNFVDAIPSHQVRHCESMLGEPGVAFVPGHGALGDAESLAPYLALLQDLERAARSAREAGTPAAAAAAAYRIPAELGDWTMFSANYIERAFAAWERELAGPGA